MKHLYFAASLFFPVLFSSGVYAQTQRTPATGNVKISIRKDDNGATSIIEERIGNEGDETIQGILDRYGISEELGKLEPGEKVEIIIRKEKADFNDKDIIIDLENIRAKPAEEKFPGYKVLSSDDVSRRALLGVYYNSMAGDLGRITEVMPGSSAQRSGLQPGDVIMKVDGEQIDTGEEIQQIIGGHQAGDKVTITFHRNGVVKETIATLGARDISDSEEPAEAPPSGASRAWMGVSYSTGADGNCSLLDKVEEGSPAQAAGLLPGDVLLTVDGRTIHTCGDLPGMISAKHPGDKVMLEYQRGTVVQRTEITLGTKHISPVRIIKEMEAEMREPICKFGIVTESSGGAEPGVAITKVIEGSPAQKMGMLPGDVLTSVNGLRVTNLLDLRHIQQLLVPGQKMEIVVRREGKEKNIRTRAQAYKIPASPDPASDKMGVVNPDPDRKWSEEIMVQIEMDEVTPNEAAALSAKTSGQFTGDNSLDVSELSLYPNPTDGRINISFNLKKQIPVSVRIFSQEGREVYTQTISGISGFYNDSVDLSRQASGVYYLQVTQEKTSFNRKIVRN